jgi:hypothetical protein
MKHIQNNKKYIEKSMPALDFKNIKKKSANQKSRDFCQMFVISKMKTIPLRYGFKNLQEIYSLAYGFLFCVISISGYSCVSSSILYRENTG